MNKKPIPSQTKDMIEEAITTFKKIQAREITYADIKEKQKEEEQLTKLQMIGYDRSEAIELLKKYSFDYLYNKAVSAESDISVSEAFGEIERREEYKRIMSRRKMFMNA